MNKNPWNWYSDRVFDWVSLGNPWVPGFDQASPGLTVVMDCAMLTEWSMVPASWDTGYLYLNVWAPYQGLDVIAWVPVTTDNVISY